MTIDMRHSSRDKTRPLGIFLVESGPKGDHLLFRFPVPDAVRAEEDITDNPYAVIDESSQAVAASAPHSAANDLFPIASRDQSPQHTVSHSHSDPHIATVMELSDKVLSDLFAVKPQLCDQKFEVKINDIRFVGHPIHFGSKNTDTDEAEKSRPISELLTLNLVFAVEASASPDVVNCYHICSQRISIALQSEEQRIGYMSKEAKAIMALHESYEHDETTRFGRHDLILSHSPLARTLSKVFSDLSSFGASHITINRWMCISLCLPQKVHLLALRHHDTPPHISPERILKCLELLRPYHGLILIVDAENLQESLPQDSSPAFLRVIKSISPTKNLQELSADCDISLSQVFSIAAQLVFWGKATVIFPLCENNKYSIHPLAPTHLSSDLLSLFAAQFDANILRFMSLFSQGVTVKELKKSAEKPSQVVEQIIWLLSRRLLLQLHKYVLFVPENKKRLQNRLILPPYRTYFEEETEEMSCISMETSRSHGTVFDQREMEQFIREIKDTSDRERFRRLYPYLNSKRHVEDIMYYEDMERSEFMKFLSRHQNVLLTFEHEDTAISHLCPYTQLQ